MSKADLAAELDRQLRQRGKGAAGALAQAADASGASVSRWRRGHDAPRPSFWPAIETFFGLETGTVSALLMQSGRASSSGSGELERLTDALEALRDAVERNTSALEKLRANS